MSTLQYVGQAISEGRAISRQDPVLARDAELARAGRPRGLRRARS